MYTLLILALALSGLPTGAALARERPEALTIGLVLAGAGQQSHVRGSGPDRRHHGWGAPIQLELGYRVDDTHRFSVKMGLGEGDGLTGTCPSALPAWAADLKGDVRGINGRKRDHLLTAWYRLDGEALSGTGYAATVGIIDATDYLDENAFANDEFGQFMNTSLVNTPTAFLPSYDFGAALEFETAAWSLRGVYMKPGLNEHGNDYAFAGLQFGLNWAASIGEGNCRVLGVATDRRFLDRAGESLKQRKGIALSLDQRLGTDLGVFARVSGQTRRAAVDFGRMVSGGLALQGTSWGRATDTIGLGLAHLTGGNGDLGVTRLAELYYRIAFNEVVSTTLDLQFMEDRLADQSLDSQAWILGLRLVAEL